MSFTEIRPYFRTRMNSLGYKEWKDGFDIENIPSTIINKTYHIESGPIDSDAMGNGSIEYNASITLRAFLSASRYPSETIDDSLIKAEVILQDLMDPENRMPTCIQNITSTNISILPLSESNNNAIILEMSFVVNVLLVI